MTDTKISLVPSKSATTCIRQHRDLPEKHMTILRLTASLAIAVSVTFLAGCQTRPPLKQVPSSARESPINTPEEAAHLKQLYERKASDDGANPITAQ